MRYGGRKEKLENINHKLDLFKNFAVEFGKEAKSSEKKLATEKNQPGNRSLWTRRGYLHGLFSQEPPTSPDAFLIDETRKLQIGFLGTLIGFSGVKAGSFSWGETSMVCLCSCLPYSRISTPHPCGALWLCVSCRHWESLSAVKTWAASPTPVLPPHCSS